MIQNILDNLRSFLIGLDSRFLDPYGWTELSIADVCYFQFRDFTKHKFYIQQSSYYKNKILIQRLDISKEDKYQSQIVIHTKKYKDFATGSYLYEYNRYLIAIQFFTLQNTKLCKIFVLDKENQVFDVEISPQQKLRF